LRGEGLGPRKARMATKRHKGHKMKTRMEDGEEALALSLALIWWLVEGKEVWCGCQVSAGATKKPRIDLYRTPS
jgi:hypothetical protein